MLQPVRAEVGAVRVREQRAHDAAVQDAQHLPIGVSGRDPPDRGHDPCAHRLVRLPVSPAVVAVGVAAEPLRIATLDLGRRQAGPLADVDLAERSVDRDGNPMCLRDDLGRGSCALQIARVDRVEPDPGEPVGELSRLAAAGIRERRIGMTLPPSFTVPLTLAVPDEEDRRHEG